jgi:pyruvyltransferase
MPSVLGRVRGRVMRTLKPLGGVIPSVRGALLGNGVTGYWHTSTVNFGDFLTPLILKHYGFTPILSSIEKAEVLSTGSILGVTPEDYAGHIIGSGLIEDVGRRFPNATIWAVRGELTRERTGASKETVLGDPGLLSSSLLKERQIRRYALGVVPHYVDHNDPRIAMIKKQFGSDVLIINVKRKPVAVLEDIDQCDCILSSSLHGLIAADAFDIPNAWMYLSDRVVGKGFKFRDYFSATGRIQNPVSLDGNERLSELIGEAQKPVESIQEIRGRLDGVFQSFRDHRVATRGK